MVYRILRIAAPAGSQAQAWCAARGGVWRSDALAGYQPGWWLRSQRNQVSRRSRRVSML